MHAFDFARPTTVPDALALGGETTMFLAGGTTLVDLMKLDVLAPDHVVDINGLPIEHLGYRGGGFVVGALVRMATLARHPVVLADYPVVSQALLRSASGQLRNMASIGGNLLQRTRCDYFRDVTQPCNRRQPGTGCPARDGDNRGHAILGTSDACVATHPSDLAVALVALDASVRLRDETGDRVVPLADFYRLPNQTPHVEHDLRAGELIIEVVVPRLAWARRSTYVKVRDRASYEFALSSAAVALDAPGGTVRDARVAVGGVGTAPWRLPDVEAALRGRPAVEKTFVAAAELATVDAKPLAHNTFKMSLVRRTIVRALLELVGAR